MRKGLAVLLVIPVVAFCCCSAAAAMTIPLPALEPKEATRQILAVASLKVKVSDGVASASIAADDLDPVHRLLRIQLQGRLRSHQGLRVECLLPALYGNLRDDRGQDSRHLGRLTLSGTPVTDRDRPPWRGQDRFAQDHYREQANPRPLNYEEVVVNINSPGGGLIAGNLDIPWFFTDPNNPDPNSPMDPNSTLDPNDPAYCWYLSQYDVDTGDGGSDLIPPFDFDISMDPLQVIDLTSRQYDFYYDARNTVGGEYVGTARVMVLGTPIPAPTTPDVTAATSVSTGSVPTIRKGLLLRLHQFGPLRWQPRRIRRSMLQVQHLVGHGLAQGNVGRCRRHVRYGRPHRVRLPEHGALRLERRHVLLHGHRVQGVSQR